MAEKKVKKTLVNRRFIHLTKIFTRTQIILALCIQKAIQHKDHKRIEQIGEVDYLIFDMKRQELSAINPKYFNTKTKAKESFKISERAFIISFSANEIGINLQFYNKYLLTLTGEVVSKKKYEYLRSKDKQKLTKEENQALKDYRKLDYFKIDLDILIKSRVGAGLIDLYLTIASRDTGLHNEFQIEAETTAKQRQQFNKSFNDYKLIKSRGSEKLLVQKRSGNNDTR